MTGPNNLSQPNPGDQVPEDIIAGLRYDGENNHSPWPDPEAVASHLGSSVESIGSVAITSSDSGVYHPMKEVGGDDPRVRLAVWRADQKDRIRNQAGGQADSDPSQS